MKPMLGYYQMKQRVWQHLNRQSSRRNEDTKKLHRAVTHTHGHTHTHKHNYEDWKVEKSIKSEKNT